jgi:cell division protein DivIC
LIYLCKLGGDRLAKAKKRKRTKRSNKKAKRRLVLLAPICLIVIGYFLISSTKYILNIVDLNQEEANLKQQLMQLKEDEGSLKNEIEKLKDPDYIARFARENYLYSKNGEYIIKITDRNNKKKQPETNLKDTYFKYVAGGCCLFGVIILSLVIRKK